MPVSLTTSTLFSRIAAVFLSVAVLILLILSIGAFLGSAVARGASEPAAAELAAWLAPSDPEALYAAGYLLERSMRPDDLSRSLAMYDKAVALEPANYLYWLALGRAKERNGDPEGAEKALLRAADLAPNYSEVLWSLGNTLIRNGKSDGGFERIKRAVAIDPKFAPPSAALAWDLYEGDIGEVRKAVGDSPAVTMSLALLLAGESRFSEAFALWKSLPRAGTDTTFAEPGARLRDSLLSAKRFREAAIVQNDLVADGGPAVATVSNPGFESDIAVTGAGAFEWKIGDGELPSVGLSIEEKHAGERSLVIVFGEGRRELFRTVEQTIAVEPGVRYELQFYYRTDLKSEKTVGWEVVDAVSGEVLARSDAFAAASDWAALAVPFAASDTSDAVTIRLVREQCVAVQCDIAGRLWLDDISLKKIDGTDSSGK